MNDNRLLNISVSITNSSAALQEELTRTIHSRASIITHFSFMSTAPRIRANGLRLGWLYCFLLFTSVSNWSSPKTPLRQGEWKTVFKSSTLVIMLAMDCPERAMCCSCACSLVPIRDSVSGTPCSNRRRLDWMSISCRCSVVLDATFIRDESARPGNQLQSPMLLLRQRGVHRIAVVTI